MTLHITERKLETLIWGSVKKALKEELMRLYAFTVPFASKEEQKEVEKLYRQPSKKTLRKIHIGL